MRLKQVAKLTSLCVSADPTAFGAIYNLVTGVWELNTVEYAKPLLFVLTFIDDALGDEYPEIRTAVREWCGGIRQAASGSAESVTLPKRRAFVRLLKLMHELYWDDPRTLADLEALVSGKMEPHEAVYPDDLRHVRGQLSQVVCKFGEELPELAGDARELSDRINQYLED